jgi:hypothetical protein
MGTIMIVTAPKRAARMASRNKARSRDPPDHNLDATITRRTNNEAADETNPTQTGRAMNSCQSVYGSPAGARQNPTALTTVPKTTDVATNSVPTIITAVAESRITLPLVRAEEASRPGEACSRRAPSRWAKG